MKLSDKKESKIDYTHGVVVQKIEKKINEFRDTKMRFFTKERPSEKKRYKSTGKEYLSFIASNSKTKISKIKKRHNSLPKKRITLEKAMILDNKKDSVIEHDSLMHKKKANSSILDSSTTDQNSNFFKVVRPNHKKVNEDKFNFFKLLGLKKKGEAEKLRTKLAVQFFNTLESCGNPSKIKVPENENSNTNLISKNKNSLNSSINSSRKNISISGSSKKKIPKYEKDKFKNIVTQILSEVIKDRVSIEEGNPKVYIRNLLITIEKFAESDSPIKPIFEIFNKKAKDMFLLTSEQKLEHIKLSISKVLSWSKVLEITTFISEKFSLFGKKKKKKKRNLFSSNLKVNIFLGQTIQDALEILTQSMNNIGEIKMKFERMLKTNIAKYKNEIKKLKETNNEQTENFAAYLKRIEGSFKQKYGEMEEKLKTQKTKNLQLKKEGFMVREVLNRLQREQGESRANRLSNQVLLLNEKISQFEKDLFEKKSENLKLKGRVDFLNIELDLAQREIKNKKNEIKSVELQFKEFEKNQVKMQMFKKNNLDPKMIKLCEIFRLMSSHEKTKFSSFSFNEQVDFATKRITEFIGDVTKVIKNKDKDKMQLLLLSLESIVEKKSRR